MTVRSYVLPGIPVNLWGWDILSQMDLLLIDTKGLDMLLVASYSPGKGLGKNLQGMPALIALAPVKNDCTGLGFFQ